MYFLTLLGKKALITKPETSKESYFPSSWMFKEGKPFIFEYSSDPYAHKIYQILEKNPNLFKEFADLLQSYQLIDELALAITERKFLEDCSEKPCLIEHSYEDPFASIVTEGEIDEEKGEKAVITAWQLSKPITYGCFCMCVYINQLHISKHW